MSNKLERGKIQSKSHKTDTKNYEIRKGQKMPSTYKKTTKRTTKKQYQQDPPKTNAEILTEATEKIIAMLETNEKPWLKGFDALQTERNFSALFPYNALTGHNYQGINVLLLWSVAAANNYDTAAFISYKQAQQLGGHVRRGEKGHSVVVWYDWTITDREENPDTGETEHKRRTIRRCKFATVFNVAQCENIREVKRRTDKHDIATRIEPLIQGKETKAESLARNYIEKSGVKLEIRKFAAGENPNYRNGHIDAITMPSQKSYQRNDEFYSTLYHEMVHSTRHEQRLDRFGISSRRDRAKEELIAELGAVFLCAATDIIPMENFEHDATANNSVSYLKNWINAVREEPKFIHEAAKYAQEAFAYILDTATKEEAA